MSPSKLFGLCPFKNKYGKLLGLIIIGSGVATTAEKDDTRPCLYITSITQTLKQIDKIQG